MIALASCLRSPTHGRVLASRSHGSRASRARAGRPLAGVFDDLTEEAKGSWLARFLPETETRDNASAPGSLYFTQQISEQPVLFTKLDAVGEPCFDYERWEVHRSNDRYGRLVLGILFGKTTQRIAPVVLAVGLFSTIVFTYNNVFLAASQGSAPLPACHLPRTTCHLPPTAYRLPPTTHDSRLTTYD